MSPRKDVSEERKAQILQAASEVFARQGFAEARMDDIAGVCGLSKGTLYLYYRSKDELIAGLLEQTFEDHLQALQGLMALDMPVRDRLLSLTDGFAEQMESQTDLIAIAYEFYAAAGRQHGVREYLQGYFARYRQLLVQLFEQGIAGGEFPPFDVENAAITLAALYEGLTLLWVTDPAAIPFAETAAKSVRVLLSGLAAGSTA